MVKTFKTAVGIVFYLYLYSGYSAAIPNVEIKRQQQSQWCWAASSTCMLNYYVPNFSKTQSQVASVITANNFAPDPTEIKRCLEMNGKSVKLKVTLLDRKLSWEEAKKAADDKQPFLFLIRWNSGGYHCNVYAGYIGDEKKIQCMDPGKSSWQYRAFSRIAKKGTWEKTFIVSNPTQINKNSLTNKILSDDFTIIFESNPSQNMIPLTCIFGTSSAKQLKGLTIYAANGQCMYETKFLKPVTNSSITVYIPQPVSCGMYYAMARMQTVNRKEIQKYKSFIVSP